MRTPFLEPGDRVRLVSPASPPDRDSVLACAATLRSWGLVVDLGRHVFDRMGYLAGTDDARLADLDDAFRDEGVRAVVATRGGKGAYRIADRLDFEALRRDPKPLVGFSEITNLHLSVARHVGLAGIHGAFLGHDGPTNGPALREALMGEGDIVVTARADETTAALTRPGVARGPLLGGNLDAVATSAGWALPSLKGAILLLEAVGTGLGQVDRQLTMLRKAGHLAGMAGVALGQFTGFATSNGYGIVDVLGYHLSTLDVPVLGGLPLGHGYDPQSVLVGSQAILDGTGGRLISHRPSAC
ncbi:muramoyltetrapeptide carboxypeptidase [Methylobacterium sp. ap11]|uniref:S66 peptidase family protein n=1 Tax=Methylobacterium sp. ap11 TaxID=1761799 RepID=UPI0008D2222D|nr:LD-carboxypeptidase [Methylobacterium sp. ap11]SEO67236.1 muramoyltetrapeptide carboxypeptidase [Methylobacterium sp. ap11]